MKRKGARDIPDFSHLHAPTAGPVKVTPGAKGAAPARTATTRARQAVVKPQTTSAKSGRRGQ